MERDRDTVIVKPGDTLVIRLEYALSEIQYEEFVADVRSKLPEGVRVLILENVAQIGVVLGREV